MIAPKAPLAAALLLLAALSGIPNARAADGPARLELREGDRVVFVGDVLAERMHQFGHVEAMLQARNPELGLTFRNLAWPADTPTTQPRPLNFGDTPKHLAEQKADVIFLCFGMTDSFSGKPGLADFAKGLDDLIRSYSSRKFNGKSAPRLVVVSPIAHEKLGGDLPDPTAHNEQLDAYADAMRKVAGANTLPFVDLFGPTLALMNEKGGEPLTFNGIHQTRYGDWAIAHVMLDQLGMAAEPTTLTLDADAPEGLDVKAYREAVAKGLPAPPPPLGAKVHPSLTGRRTRIAVKNLAKGEEFILKINGQPAGTARAEDWAAGDVRFFGPAERAAEQLRLAIVEKDRQFFFRWRAVNGEYIYGRRAEPFGVVSFPPEMKQLDEMVAAGDADILAKNRAPKIESIEAVQVSPGAPAAELAKKAPEAKGQTPYELYHQERGTINGVPVATAASTDEALKQFKVADGYEINLFASEKDFPISKPVAMKFDAKGRMWVSTMPTYPQYIPGHPPDDKLIILEDTDGDGVADTHKVFADKLYLPGAFEFAKGGVYVAEQPNLTFAKDTDGDDVADTRETVLHGFGTGDSHHAINAFTLDPAGALYMMEGTFHVSAVESPFGPTRLHDAGVFRFEPRTGKVEVSVSYPFANPWGHVYDHWGQNFIADASGGSNYFGLPITGHVDHPRKHPGMKEFTLTKVRPTCGCEFVRSRHFPESAQGNFLLNNCIGFQGIKQYRVTEEGSGFVGKEVEPLLFSTDPNFRPVDITFGPDGALYIVDWYNPLIGHMQYSIRNPGRDHVHGRIWRITAKGRPLVEPARIAGEPIPKLLDLLKTYEDRTRYRVRMELRDRDKAEVADATKAWIAALDPKDPAYEHHLLEALWVYQGVEITEIDLLKRLLKAKDYHARAAATRVLRHAKDKVDDALAIFRSQANEEHPRVRLEAVVALSDFRVPEAAEAALEVLKYPLDDYLTYGLRETMTTLEPYWRPAVASGRPFAAGNPAGADFILERLTTAELAKMPRTAGVSLALLSREGVLPEDRREALAGLAKAHGTDELAELFAAIGRIDAGDGPHAAHILNDLAQLLTARPAAELAGARPRLVELAEKARKPVTRQVADVTLIAVDGSIDRTFAAASKSFATLTQWVEALPLVADPKLRASAFERVRKLLDGPPEGLASGSNQEQAPRGRFVRIELPGTTKTLTLAEVQVFSQGVNVARQGKASQSSTAFGGEADRAIDGNLSGTFEDGGQTHTLENARFPWWEVDLLEERPIESIAVWNRTGGTFGKRLEGFKLTVRDARGKVVLAKENNPAPESVARFTLFDDPRGALRRAAMGALAAMPGREPDAFTAISGFFRRGEDRDAAIRSIRRIPRGAWPKDQIRPTLDAIVAYVSKLPASERSEPSALDAFQLGSDLAALLPKSEAAPIRETLGELGVNVVLVRTVPHKMVFDRAKFYVEAGKPVVLVLENPDIMPHNLVVSAPGSLADLGLAAEKMATAPDGFARNFIPDDERVLHATRLIQPGETARLQFEAPRNPGEYPYVCTFPGHWRVMNGTMHVVSKLSDVPAEDLLPPAEALAETRPFVRKWTREELLPELHHAGHGRDFERGRAMFRAATCVQCHKVQGEGNEVGPDLSELPKKVSDGKLTRADVLREVLEPSAVIDEKYRPVVIATEDGGVVTGIVVGKTDKALTVLSGPQAKPKEVLKEDIAEQVESKISLMPEGLLVTLSKEEILDLLAYILAGGDANHPAFARP